MSCSVVSDRHKFNIYLKLQTFFSENLLDFQDLTRTNYDHCYGDVVTFNERLTALGGWKTRKVEVYEDGSWNHQTIPAIGNKEGFLRSFTSLVIHSQLYVFGNI